MPFSCPRCRTALMQDAEEYRCEGCGALYPVIDGIPVFADVADTTHDEIDHLMGSDEHEHADGADGHKAAQSRWFDRETVAEFEIERPLGAPALYRFLLGEKFRRSLRPLGERLDGWTALTVCGGSGMDAEFLARAGASVISSDLSLGAARRVRERAARHRVALTAIVADVERLPFADRSVDLVYVHDGLHHLLDPFAGLAEMARVARRAVSVSEPARATLTALAVRARLALEHEEAGNRVARLDLAAVEAALEAAELRVVHAERYAMYYRHLPGRMSSVLSRRAVLPVATRAWRASNALGGRFGNKLSVVAVR